MNTASNSVGPIYGYNQQKALHCSMQKSSEKSIPDPESGPDGNSDSETGPSPVEA